MCNPFFIGDSFREAEHINSEFRIPNSDFQIYLIASFIDLTYS